MRAAHWIFRIRPLVLLIAQLIFLIPAQLFAAQLAFTFHDMAGDPRDKTDVTKVHFQFDDQAGNFNVEVTTDPANPFNGTHLLYLSVFNPDVGTTDPAISFFEIGRFSFTAATPTTVLSRTGSSPVLKHWSAGQRVASYDILGVPANRASFYSVLGGNTASFNNSDEILDQAVIILVPEPVTGLLASIGLAMVLTQRFARR